MEITIGADELYNNSFYGLWITEEFTTLFDREKVFKSAKDHKISGWKFRSDYPFYKLLPEDFSQYSSLRKIQPGKRSSLVNHYSNEIVRAINELEPFINKYILKKK